MKIELIEQNARIDIRSLTDDIRKQWIESGAINKEQAVVAGIAMENGQWFINLRVVNPPNKSSIIKPHGKIIGLS